ncbi:Wadjet anti-phage system protein JetD domain-containing protein [Deefgea piscis]|uniref:Wadjet anti-phage system protein JetD domain-containing protein n=1 Tax=Deefgea piscis TaxID=2739061 RepID=UPI001C7F3750|nr:Wadjet anti-phage system protein JetD domain-containing protein [Deefgea piscis]QZA82260.1 DUF2220 domain-containing protein [Deefgea piscis]
MSDSFLSVLENASRKRIVLDDVRRAFFVAHPETITAPNRNALLLERLRELEKACCIKLPAAGSWEKVGNPPLPKWVQVTGMETSTPNFEDYASVAWVPELGFWPELKLPALETARLINDYLLSHRNKLRLVPIKERSLEIFGDEKRLDSLRTSGSATLFGGRLPLSVLGAFVVPSPLPYRMSNVVGAPVLIVENHNSFWSFGEWNQHAKRYSAVVYGSGKAFQGSGNALEQVLIEVGGVSAQYLGDLDPAGVRIPIEFNRTRSSVSSMVAPAIELYRWLLENGHKRVLCEQHNGLRSLAEEWLGNELGAELSELWISGHWIPQEALGFERLMATPMQF